MCCDIIGLSCKNLAFLEWNRIRYVVEGGLVKKNHKKRKSEGELEGDGYFGGGRGEYVIEEDV
jgi:hypothetical protein